VIVNNSRRPSRIWRSNSAKLVEAAVEADHQRHAAFPDDCNARLGTAAVEVERLFAEHRLAGACRGLQGNCRWLARAHWRGKTPLAGRKG
jgi:hypothetical protein